MYRRPMLNSHSPGLTICLPGVLLTGTGVGVGGVPPAGLDVGGRLVGGVAEAGACGVAVAGPGATGVRVGISTVGNGVLTAA